MTPSADSADHERHAATTDSGEREHIFNEDFPWDEFASEWYHHLNYAKLRSDDREILCTVRDFFAEAHAADRPGAGWSGIDVGAGANLYPSLCMLPYCDRIRLHEFSASNVDWLKREIGGGYRPSWDPFWDALAEREPYAALTDPRERLRRIAEVRQGSVFPEALVPDPNASNGTDGPTRNVLHGLPTRQWDIGTMFFGAESMTTDRAEFDVAMAQFMHALRPGSPFAAAFMMESKGYRVGDEEFPAVAINVDDVTECLDSLAYTVDIRVTGLEADLRVGYGGMIVATGRVNGNGGGL